MNNETVYQIAKALSKEEQFLLFEKLKSDFNIETRRPRKRNVALTKAQATHYLLTRIFNKRN